MGVAGCLCAFTKTPCRVVLVALLRTAPVAVGRRQAIEDLVQACSEVEIHGLVRRDVHDELLFHQCVHCSIPEELAQLFGGNGQEVAHEFDLFRIHATMNIRREIVKDLAEGALHDFENTLQRHCCCPFLSRGLETRFERH